MLAQASRPLIRWDWVTSHAGEIWDRVFQHLALTGIAVGVGFGLSFALALVALRFRFAYTPITWFAGILYTIPSLALFALLVPLTGLSTLTAEIGLVSYTLLILVRNIVAGVDGVAAPVKEAALGMGFTERGRFWMVELPLATPAIIAGLRIASVTTVGLVTVTALIGKGGLGFFILRGLQTFFWTQILVGVVLSVAIATVIDVGFVVLGQLLTPWVRRRAAT